MSKYVWGDQETQFFFDLDPHTVLDATSQIGLTTTGRCLTLNSMENRVYEIELDIPEAELNSVSDGFIVAKFYRPGRWTENQIRDEHQFLLDAFTDDISVIPPKKINGETLFKLEGHKLFYTIFPKKGGRAPEELTDEQIEVLGRTVARLHNIGEAKPSHHRIKITPESYGIQNLEWLLESKTIPFHLEKNYERVVRELCELSAPYFENINNHRIHGDLHLGNIIWRDNEGAFLIDFDDMLVGPAIQDLWPIIPGEDQESIRQRNLLIDSYAEMRDFDHQTIKLIEPLRALRYIHFSAWISKRWEDPAFKAAFVHFGNEHYWDVQINDLEHQLQKIKNFTSTANY